MLNFLLRRVGSGALSLFVIAMLVFFLLQALPGGPFDSEKSLPPEILRNIEAYYGLDRPLWEQFLRYLTHAIQGDLGVSYSQRDLPVVDLIAQRLPISMELGVYSMLLGILLGLPLGALAAAYHNRWPDFLATFLAILGRSIPNLALAPLLALFFGLYLKWLPIARWTGWDSKVLPTVALGLGVAALISRLVRSSMLQVIQEDFVRTARAKGLSTFTVLGRHVLRNALLPVLTILGPLFAYTLTGTLVVEQIFSIPGLGSYFITSISNRDYPVVMGVYLLYGLLVIVLNTLVDILYAWADPRIRLE
ncbi:MAG: ABC transporter permease [bacterium]|jgi:ABC-type dipeptide/oligopeptide/nickel transport system permease component